MFQQILSQNVIRTEPVTGVSLFQFERVTTRMPVGLIDDHCKLIPWVFFQLMYYDKQAQVRNSRIRSLKLGNVS